MDEYPENNDVNLVSDPMKAGIARHDQLETYALAFRLANEVFVLSKSFPREERYSLTDQIRRSSRSVCANIAEAWRKRRYRAAFQNSLNHAEAEAAETQTWVQFAEECGYLDKESATRLKLEYEKVLKMLVKMISYPDPWILPIKNRADK